MLRALCLLLLLLAPFALGAPSVVFSILLHRHGARSPASCFPLDVDPNCLLWPDGLGMLTQLGEAPPFRPFVCVCLCHATHS